MTITKDGIDRDQNKCETMEINDNNSRSQYTIGSNDFIRKYKHEKEVCYITKIKLRNLYNTFVLVLKYKYAKNVFIKYFNYFFHK